MTRHEYIDFKAAIAQMEIHRMAHEAKKSVSRIAHFTNRSNGQLKRYAKEKQT